METELLTAIQDLQSAVRQQTELLARLVAQQKESSADWISEQEAARILGLNNAPSTTRRKLRFATEQYKVRHTNTRPNRYHRQDIQELNKKIQEGRAILLSG